MRPALRFLAGSAVELAAFLLSWGIACCAVPGTWNESPEEVPANRHERRAQAKEDRIREKARRRQKLRGRSR